MAKELEQDAQVIEDESSTKDTDDLVPPSNGRTDLVLPGAKNEDSKEKMVTFSEYKKVRSEAATYRKELQALKAKRDEELRDTELTKADEIDKLRLAAEKSSAEADSLKGRVSQTAKELAIINAASVLDFFNPKDASSLIDTGEIEVDANGDINEAKVLELVTALGELKPYLRKDQSKAYYGPTNPAPQQGNWPKVKLTTANQIDQLKQQSRELTKQGRIVDATKLFNQAWEMEHGIKRK